MSEKISHSFLSKQEELLLHGALYDKSYDGMTDSYPEVLIAEDKRTGQTSAEFIDDFEMLSKQEARLQRFDARSMGRIIVGYYDSLTNSGEIDITTNRRR